MPESSPPRRLPAILFAAFGYFFAGRLGVEFATLDSQVSPFWPAAGLAAALAIIQGPVVVWGLLVGGLVSAVWDGQSPLYCVVAGLAAAVGAWVAGRIHPRARAGAEPLGGFADSAALAATALLASFASAAVGATGVYLSGEQTSGTFGTMFSTWWTGDAIGILVVSPLFLSLRQQVMSGVSLAGWALRLFAALILMSTAILFSFFFPEGRYWILLIFPLLLFAHVHAGEGGLHLAVWFGTVVCVLAVRLGYRPFDESYLQGRMLGVQVYVFTMAVVALLLRGFGLLRWRSLPSLLLLLGWSLSAWIYSELSHGEHQLAEVRLQRLAESVEGDMEGRMQTYVDTLRGGSGLISAVPNFSVDDWRRYTLALELERRYPALWGLGVIFPVAMGGEADLAGRIRSQTGRDFLIHGVAGAGAVPPDPAGERKFVISIVEPVEKNLQAVGLDVASEANRKDAAMESRDTGLPVMSRRIRLVQDNDVRAAFLLYLPFYRGGQTPSTLAERREHFLGWIYAPVVTEQFIKEALSDHIEDLNMYLFEGNNTTDRRNLLVSTAALPSDDAYDRLRTVKLAGETFTVGWHWQAGRDGGEGVGGVVTAGSVALASTLLAGLVVSLQSFAGRARREAADRTAELRTVNAELAENNRSLLEAEGRLRANEAELTKLAFVAARTGNAVVITDAVGRIEWINESFTRITGYTLEEAKGRKPGSFLQGPGTSPESIACFREKLRCQTGFRIDILNYRKDGGEIWLSIEVQPLKDAAGRVINYVGVEIDVTEERRSKAELERARQEAEAASRAKSAFLGNISHELRTPLNVIIGSTEMVLRGRHGPVSETQAPVLQRVRESGGLLLGLINELLDLTRAESGRIELDNEPVEVAVLCRELLRLLEPSAAERRITLRLDLANRSPAILADGRRLKQVLLNLLGNALKFTPALGVVELLVAETAEPPEIVFTVRDTGPGIPAADQERVFLEFERVEGDRRVSVGGTGLGLPIARRLTELHGGTLTVASEPGKGSSFFVRLPLRIPEPKHEAQVASSNSAPAFPIPADGRVVLVAEDYPANLELITSYLEAEGFRVAAARNGREAVEKARAMLPDIVLMDMKMPVMDGLEAIRQLRQDERTRSLPIIALTAFAYESDARRSREAGADEYVSKPVDFDRLDRALQRCLSPQRAVRQS